MKPSVCEKSNNTLNKYAKSFASQGGEDGIIERILELVGNQNKWCVEFGSWDGKHLSNTYNLVANHNYAAVLIEGDKERFGVLQQNFKDNSKIIPVNNFVGFCENDGLDKILEKTEIPTDFDLLSIDIDGNDYHIWNAVQKYQPKIVVIEFNPTVPSTVEFVQPKNMKVNQGSGILAMVKLANLKGYELAAIESANAFFVKKKYFELLAINDNSIDQLWLDKSQITNIFFGYDGTVFVRGLKVHPWQSVTIDEAKMQILPKWIRTRFGEQAYLFKKLRKYYMRIKKIKKRKSGAN